MSQTLKRFDRVLIANRGEIVTRVARSAHAMGLQTVAVYSNADRLSPHLHSCNTALCIGGEHALDSYLAVPKLLQAAKDSGANAVHPGYGFLSENADFASMVEKNDLIFIGPTAASIILMGDKIGSKNALEKINIPMIPGYHGDDQSEENLAKQAIKIGFPVLIKASAGGGGKGMRIVHQESELIESIRGAKSEALKSFSNDKVLIERYVINPRHIEVQLMSDTHGNHLHFFERECSIQRRYQKVIEETPAPNLSDELRLKICQTAVQISSGINFRGAGTIEFILAPDG
jgi:3-methylcrotonyl-CoA carboxylase alpha subunit